MSGISTATWEHFCASVANPSPLVLNHQQQGKGDPLLLIHGFGESLYTWRHLVPGLAQRHHVIAIDLKGFGASPKPDDDTYHVYEQARLVLQFIAHHDLRRLTVIGNSLGGGVALIAALYLNQHDPGRLQRLVLIGSIAYPQPLPWFVRLPAMPIIGPLSLTLLPDRLLIRSVLAFAYFDDDAVPDDAVDVYARNLESPASRRALVATARQVVPADIDRLSKRYPRIGQPTLIIWGRQDRIVPLWVGQRLDASLPDSRLVVLEDTGHVPQEERPTQTQAVIDEFLRTTGANSDRMAP
jgi:pimeloyl-ACP methyl ester carboxylesterase